MKALETRYAGCRFRSRLEARWAVFFDHMGIEWQYEPQGFDIEGTPYLPDFHLPKTRTWVEVKGSEEDFRDHEALYAYALDFGGYLPDVGNSWGSERGLLILGDIPRLQERRSAIGSKYRQCPAHPLLQHNEGVLVSWASFGESGLWARSHGDGTCSTAPDLPTIDGSWTGEHVFSAPTPRKAERAYIAARSARFEHGESG